MYFTSEAAKVLGIPNSTLLQRANELEEGGYKISRNKNNYRVFTDEDLNTIKGYVNQKEENQIKGISVTGSPKPVDEINTKEYKGQRVVTFSDIDGVHGRAEGTARRNFNRNKKHLIEGEDYFKISPNEIRSRKLFVISPMVREDVTLLTESGYLLLVKSFTDDLAWQVQRELVNGYFRVKDVVSQKASFEIDDPIERAKRWIIEHEEKLLLEQRISEYEPKVTYYDKILQSKDSMTVTQIAKDYGLTAQELNKILHREGVQYKLSKQWLLYKNHADKGYTKTETTSFTKRDGTIGTSILTKWTQKGRLFIHELLTGLGYDPDDLGDSE